MAENVAQACHWTQIGYSFPEFGYNTDTAFTELCFMENKTIKRLALVTGANQGVGLEVVKKLVAAGHTVLLGSRDLAKGEAAAKDWGAGAIAIQIDVTDQSSIDAAAKYITARILSNAKTSSGERPANKLSRSTRWQ